MNKVFLVILGVVFIVGIIGLIFMLIMKNKTDYSIQPTINNKQISEIDANEAITQFKSKSGSAFSRSEEAKILVPLLKIGMTKEEVETLLGKPDRINYSDGYLFWMYGLFYSQLIDIQFDSEGKVLKIEASAPGLGNNSSGYYKIEKNP